jgi:hypothetical protein
MTPDLHYIADQMDLEASHGESALLRHACLTATDRQQIAAKVASFRKLASELRSTSDHAAALCAIEQHLRETAA